MSSLGSPRLSRLTLKVMGRWSVRTVDVRADGTGLCSRAGSALLSLVADRVGLTGGLRALRATRERRSGHVPGRVICDLAVMLADGGRCVSDLAALAGEESLFGNVASVSTARRVVQSVSEGELAGIRAARGGCSHSRVGGGCSAGADDRLRRDPDRGALREGAGGRAVQGRVRVQPADRVLRRGRSWPGSSQAGGTPARTTPRITSRCWISRSSSCRKARWTDPRAL
jgi:hypothetical protein